MENFMNEPIKSESLESDILKAYRQGIDVKTLSKQYLLPVTEIKKIIKKN